MHETLKHIKDSLSDLYSPGEASSISRMIIEKISGLSYPMLVGNKNNKITPEQVQRIDELIVRLKKNEPIQYVLGEAEFYGLNFMVDKNVLIPRPETEELVELIINENKGQAGLNILDIGTGSGCIAIALKKYLPDCNITAWDVSGEALVVACRNAERNSVDINFQQVDVLGEVPAQHFDVIVSNPPYILEEEKQNMENNVLGYEPHLALFVPNDRGLLFYERIADIAKTALTKNGRLYFEINSAKGLETLEMLSTKAYNNISLIKDLSGNDRIVKAGV